MNHSQRARLAHRDRGQRRVTQVTRGIAASGSLTAAVIATVLAQGPASALTASTTTDPQPGAELRARVTEQATGHPAVARVAVSHGAISGGAVPRAAVWAAGRHTGIAAPGGGAATRAWWSIAHPVGQLVTTAARNTGDEQLPIQLSARQATPTASRRTPTQQPFRVRLPSMLTRRA